MKATADKRNELVAADGTRLGDRIKGSKYLRGFCIYCNEPMRVVAGKLLTCACTQCEPSKRRKLFPGEMTTVGGVLRRLKEKYGDGFIGNSL